MAVFIPEWDKWVRGHVECETRDGRRFLLWTIDYGRPLLADVKHIVALPEELGNDPLRVVFLGGVINAVPGKNIFNVHTGKLEIIGTKSWTANAVEVMEKSIRQASLIEFEPILRYGRQTFGHVQFYRHTGSHHSAAGILRAMYESMDTICPDFLPALNRTDAINNARYRNNAGEPDFHWSSFRRPIDHDEPIELMVGAPFNQKDEAVDRNNSMAIPDHIRDDVSTVSSVDMDVYNEFFDDSISQIASKDHNDPDAKHASVQNRLAQALIVKNDEVPEQPRSSSSGISTDSGHTTKTVYTVDQPISAPVSSADVQEKVDVKSDYSDMLRAALANRNSAAKSPVKTSVPISAESSPEVKSSIIPTTFGGYSKDNGLDPVMVQAMQMKAMSLGCTGPKPCAPKRVSSVNDRLRK